MLISVIKKQFFIKSAVIFFGLFGISCCTIFITCNLLNNNPQPRPIEPRLLGEWVNSDTLWESDSKKNRIAHFFNFSDDRTYRRSIWKQIGDTFSYIDGSYGAWYKYADTGIFVSYSYSEYQGHPGGTTYEQFFFHFDSLNIIQLYYFNGEFFPWSGWKKFVKVDSIHNNKIWF
jgi:hypothetical protein